MKCPKFKVCIRCMTYNQAKYIVDTMNGFAIQQTDFPFVCCIVDDASTDGEQQVIKEYLIKYFELADSSVFFLRLLIMLLSFLPNIRRIKIVILQFCF